MRVKLSWIRNILYIFAFILLVTGAYLSSGNLLHKANAQATCPDNTTTLASLTAPFDNLTSTDVVVEGPRTTITMGNPMRIVEDGYAHVFTFDVLEGQRVETLAYENDLDTIGSYVHTHLYDPSGTLLESGDTRRQFTAQESGTYYVVVTTFGCKQGSVTFRAMDMQVNRDLQAWWRASDGTMGDAPDVTSDLPYQIIVGARTLVSVEADSAYFNSKMQSESNGQFYERQSIYSVTDGIDSDAVIPTRATKLDSSRFLITPIDSYFFPAGSTVELNISHQNWVNVTDPPYSILGSGYAASFIPTVESAACAADITRDGIVDLRDYSRLVSSFFQTCN